jgi:hypothetical protein
MKQKLLLVLLFFSFFNLTFTKPYPDYPMLEQYRKEDPIEVHYVEPKDLSRYRVTFSDNLKVFVGGKAVESNSLTFVMDKDGNIYASPDKMYLHHSSYLRGQNVACGGHLFLSDGVLSTVMNSSGHYAPPAKSLISVAEELLARGIDIEGVDFIPVQNQELHNIEAEVKSMISEKKKEARIKAKGCRSILDQILG